MMSGMRPATLSSRHGHPLFKELAIRWDVLRFSRTLWRFFPRWQLTGLFLLVMASVLFLASQGSLWGPFLLFPAVSYLAQCFHETWPKALESYIPQLLAQAREAHQAGHLSRSLRLARTAEALTKDYRYHTQALELQAQLLLLQGFGA